MTEAEHGSPDLDSLRRRDEGAFTWLVNQHRSLVMALGRSLGLSGADLDDAAAETFAAIYTALPGFAGRSHLRAWIYSIAHRTMCRLRQQARKRHFSELPDAQPDHRQASPEHHAQVHEESLRIWAAVSLLDPREAAAIQLYYREDWPLDEIAEALNCPVNTVKTLLFRGRERLRRRLHKEKHP